MVSVAAPGPVIVVESEIGSCVPPSVIVPASAVRLMVSAPLPATQSPPVVSELEFAFANASRTVHCASPAVVLSASELTVIVAACAPTAVSEAAPAANAVSAFFDFLLPPLAPRTSSVLFDWVRLDIPPPPTSRFWNRDYEGFGRAMSTITKSIRRT